MKAEISHLHQIFSTIDVEIIEAVYEANNRNFDDTVVALIEISDHEPTSTQPTQMSRQDQILADEIMAHDLAEPIRHRTTEEKAYRDLKAHVDRLGDDSVNDEFKHIAESIKRGVEGVKDVFKRVSLKITGPKVETTRYHDLPASEFEQFLNDDDAR